MKDLVYLPKQPLRARRLPLTQHPASSERGSVMRQLEKTSLADSQTHPAYRLLTKQTFFFFSTTLCACKTDEVQFATGVLT